MSGAPGPLFRLIRNQKVAFLMVGAANTAIGFGFFVFFELTIGVVYGYLVTLVFAHVFSVICAFFLYRTFVFKVRGNFFGDLARFELVYLTSLGVNFVLLPILVELAGLPPITAQALIVFVTAMISFFGHRDFSFRRKTPLQDEPAALPTPTPTPEEADPVTPKVSIVIPAYNNADYLAETVGSVLAQTFQDFEVIISDHSSTDATWEVMQGFAGDPRFRLLKTEAGGGALRNWNRVSQEATGEYIKLVCGDDLLYPEILAQQVAALDAAPTAVLAASKRDIVDANSAPIIRARGLAGLSGVSDGGLAVRKTVRAGTNIFGEPGCVLLRRRDLEAIGWWDDRWPYLIDETTYARVLLRGDVIGVGSGALAGFRVSDSQWSVRLAGSQHQAASAFHQWMHEAHPDIVSRADVVVGNLTARAMALARRLTYLYLGRRMSKTKANVA